MKKNQISYFELPTDNVAALKHFYGDLFGWSFQDFGPDYASFSDSGVQGGFNAAPEGKPKAPLAIIETDEIEALEAKVRDAGATITVPTFVYPPGKTLPLY